MSEPGKVKQTGFRGAYAQALAARRKILDENRPLPRWDAPVLSQAERQQLIREWRVRRLKDACGAT